MNKQKITVLYRLSEKALRNYFLQGKKTEIEHQIIIETDNEKVIERAKLIDNNYLEIKELIGATDFFKDIKYSEKDTDKGVGEPKTMTIFSVFKDTSLELGKMADKASDTIRPTITDADSPNIKQHPGYIDILL